MGRTTRSLSCTPCFVVIRGRWHQIQFFLLICPRILPYICTHRLELLCLHLLCLLNLLPIFSLHLVCLSWIWRLSNRLRSARSFTLSSESASMRFQGVGHAATRVVTTCTWADFKAWLWSQVVRDGLAFSLGVAHAAAFSLNPSSSSFFLVYLHFGFRFYCWLLLFFFCRSRCGPAPF